MYKSGHNKSDRQPVIRKRQQYDRFEMTNQALCKMTNQALCKMTNHWLIDLKLLVSLKNHVSAVSMDIFPGPAW